MTIKENTDISVTTYKKVLSMSYEGAKMYIRANPDLIYKGVPLAIAFYFAAPIVSTAWCWLPWIYISYSCYNRLPTGSIPNTISVVKKYFQSSPHNYYTK